MTNSAGFWWRRAYEQNRDLIAGVENGFAANPVSAYAYANDADGRRTLGIDTTQALAVSNTFAYNEKAEVSNAVMGEITYGYVYDDIGNRLESSVNALSSSYTANNLNQYTAIAGAMACSPTYDVDGNMTCDGKHVNSWDGENRLIRSEPSGIATNGAVLVENSYDYQNRRFKKTVKQLSGRGAGYPMDPSQPGTWDAVEIRRYIWDNWNIAAEIVIADAAGTTNINYNTWGLDLSGSLQGAGGVGGLLVVTKASSSATNAHFAGADANGNVTVYVDDGGTAVAHYEYSAFGETTAKSGSMADDFTHRFSTKPFDVETGYSKYQQRDYIPPLARWASRDPVEEDGGVNLYGSLANAPINDVDVLGQWSLVYNGTWERSEIDSVTLAFADLKVTMPLYLVRLRQWMVAATKLPAECAYKAKFQQELTKMYQILSMMQDGLNSATPLNVYKKNMDADTNAKGGFPWSKFPFYLGNTFNGKISLNTTAANAFTDWNSNEMNSAIFHELSHVAGVPYDDDRTEWWSDNAHNVTLIQSNPSRYTLRGAVEKAEIRQGSDCCPALHKWMPN